MSRTSSRIASLALRHGLSKSQVYKEIYTGRLKARKVGEATLITDEDEAAWLEAMPRELSKRRRGWQLRSQRSADFSDSNEAV